MNTNSNSTIIIVRVYCNVVLVLCSVLQLCSAINNTNMNRKGITAILYCVFWCHVVVLSTLILILVLLIVLLVRVRVRVRVSQPYTEG